MKEDVQHNRQGKPIMSASLNTLVRNLANTGRGRKQVCAASVDTLLIVFCLWAAYTLRHGVLFSDFKSTWHIFALLPVVTIALFAGLGIYRWVVRSTNHRLTAQLLKGSCLSALVLLVIFFILPADRANPRSLFVIYGLLLFLSTSSVRTLWRSIAGSDELGEPVAIYGAGSAGQQLVNLLANSSKYRPIVFFDDNPELTGKTLLGLSVYQGTGESLLDTIKRLDVNKVVLAIPSSSNAVYQNKVLELGDAGLSVLAMPSIEDLMKGTARAEQIRDVSVNDILGRSVVMPDAELMGRRVSGRVVLVTGGGGSIGSELCRQVMKLSASKLIVLDNCEANLYHITEELMRSSGGVLESHSPEFLPVLGSVTDRDRMFRLVSDNDVDTVFHAAAYKHVPIVEAQPDQGVAVNIFGTKNVLDAAIEYSVADFVLISTDKAVRPTNSMGASKRVAELILQAKAATVTNTRISMVRFGNVLGSSGSVVPKFKRQILDGGPITLTHREVTRYFMTIPEAAQLVLQAGALAKGGDVFVLDMGEPVKIYDLAKTMVRLYRKELQSDTGNPEDIEIKIEGLRPGEKLYEELFLSEDETPTQVKKIFSCNEVWLEWSKLHKVLSILEGNEDLIQVRNELMKLAFLGQRTADAELNAEFNAEHKNSDRGVHDDASVASIH